EDDDTELSEEDDDDPDEAEPEDDAAGDEADDDPLVTQLREQNSGLQAQVAELMQVVQSLNGKLTDLSSQQEQAQQQAVADQERAALEKFVERWRGMDPEAAAREQLEVV